VYIKEVDLKKKKKKKKKRQGRALCLTAEKKITWAPEEKDRFTVSHMNADIKCQKSSPEKS
jgi:transcription initiation factor TFIIH subunit 1